MENLVEKPAKMNRIVYGMAIPQENERIEMPPENSSTIKELNGEMTIQLEDNTVIKEDGKILARLTNKDLEQKVPILSRIMTSKRILRKEAEEATKRYMEEKGFTSIEEIIEDNKKVPKMPEITGDFEGEINENGEIVRNTADMDR